MSAFVGLPAGLLHDLLVEVSLVEVPPATLRRTSCNLISQLSNACVSGLWDEDVDPTATPLVSAFATRVGVCLSLTRRATLQISMK